MTYCVATFVQRGSMPIYRLEICFRWRHLRIVRTGRIERLVAADPKIDARRADECIDFGQDEISANRRRRDGKRFRQIFTLLAIEDRETLEKWDRAREVAVAFGPLAFVIRDEVVGIDNRRAVLAFADVAASAQGLAEGEPTLASESSRDDGVPEDKYIHAGVSAPRGCIFRHGKRRLRRRRSPRLDPGHPARFQFGDDLVGDFGIKARPV